MKAMVLKEYSQPLVYCEDYPDPVIQSEDDVIIKVLACGLCTTDLKVQHGALDSEGLPRILGHEPAGIVTAVGSNVTNVKIGDRVISSTYMVCKSCEFCRQGRDTLCVNLQGRLGITVDGGFAEYMRVKAPCLVKIPDGVDEAQACIIPCGGGVPFHAMVRRTKVGPADRVIILGAGGIGVQAVQMCKLAGAEVVAVDIDAEKLELAHERGADHIINTRNPRYLEELKALGGATVLFDTVGLHSLLDNCTQALKKGARIVMVAYGPNKQIHMELEKIVRNEFEILGSNGVGIGDVSSMMTLLAQGKVSPEVTRYPLSALNEVIAKMESNELIGRAVLVP